MRETKVQVRDGFAENPPTQRRAAGTAAIGNHYRKSLVLRAGPERGLPEPRVAQHGDAGRRGFNSVLVRVVDFGAGRRQTPLRVLVPKVRPRSASERCGGPTTLGNEYGPVTSAASTLSYPATATSPGTLTPAQ